MRRVKSPVSLLANRFSAFKGPLFCGQRKNISATALLSQLTPPAPTPCPAYRARDTDRSDAFAHLPPWFLFVLRPWRHRVVDRQLQLERARNLELGREVHTEKAHADRARQEVDALTQSKQAVEAAHRYGTVVQGAAQYILISM